MDTSDADEAAAVLRPVFFPLDITPGGGETLRIRVKAEPLPLLGVGYLEMGGEAVIRAMDVVGHHIAIALSGHATITWSDRHAGTVIAPGAATVFTAGTISETTCSQDCVLLGIKFDEGATLHELESLLNRPLRAPIEFPRQLDLTAPAAVNWLSLVRVMCQEAGRADGMLRHHLAVANLQQLLIEGLLLTQPHNYTDELHDGGPSASHAVVKSAIDLMRSYPESAWTTPRLARELGVSSRALQKAFAKSGESPPMAYLRHLRLHRVRGELVDASRAGTSVAVTAAASRWGFVHLGRFAQQYRQAFGESPSQTLRSSDRDR
ncbi:AraC family transcriptional regulator [Mycolicibacterium madagascariense]|uniref:AraC family transcriptional regulator n=1 Tax=Mycolicibacterium madagascariense TaxID=212765 RepID=A0A7I7X909_9MYCO|nr:AraC family transcriptional regulator [Mycolicibacterium madagascariense]MCV7011838.1 AraC family transcriptional regulator [Mycolicibacterium madagascariense]BBZ26309.1 AraC family transcriptional regulator [Mycolicibacterium madagascariense]